MNNFDERDLNLPLERAREKKSLKLEIGDTFWTGVSGVAHSFGNNAQGWKIFT